MIYAMPTPLLRSLPFLMPIVIIAAARFVTYTDWAASNAGWAAILFAWLVFDGLLLGLLATSPSHKPTAFQALGVVSLACAVVLFGAAAPVREVYLGLPQLLTAFAGTIALFLVWSSMRFGIAWRRTGSFENAARAVLPPTVAHLVLAEIRVINLALFRWNSPVDVPAGALAFSYHTYLTPMIAALVVLQVIELSVVHLLMMLWNPALAWVLLGISLWGLIWTIALMKSFRINPVLLTDATIRARSGMVHDVEIPHHLIADWGAPFTAEELQHKSILNLALLSSPNVSLRFARPIIIPTMLGGTRELSGVALRLEQPAEFLAELERMQGLNHSM